MARVLLNTIGQRGSTAATGTLSGYSGTTPTAGWLLSDGRTIGNSDSGATSLADDTALNLFVHLWNSYSQSQLPIQNSAGGGSVRSATAEEDWNLNKRMPLPDFRGRVLTGLDNMGGTAANRITNAISGIDGTTLGASGGDQRSQQHTHEMNHTHSIAHNHAAANSQAESVSHVHISADQSGPGGGNSNLQFIATSIDTNATGQKNTRENNQSHTHVVDLPNFTGPSGPPSTNLVEPYGVGNSQNVQPTQMASIIIKL